MKRLFTLTMLISFAMVCACQKQGSAAERQLAQRKAELDARERALVEREKALDERERALIERENATAIARTIARGTPGQTPDPAQVQAERDRKLQQLPAQWDADLNKRIQQLPPEVRALIPDAEQAKAQMQKRFAEVQRQAQERVNPSLAAPAGAGTASPPQLAPLSVYPQPEATSPSPSPTPQ